MTPPNDSTPEVRRPVPADMPGRDVLAFWLTVLWFGIVAFAYLKAFLTHR
ncbi:MAG: hypothetical protein GEEBNDBF_00326 [bacterium]|nr:hypothetical protein [bacterium]